MEVTESGITILIKLLQFQKGHILQLPIDLTELGMIVFLQPAIKVLLAVSIIALQSSRESYIGLAPCTVILVREGQSENTIFPI